ncbi:type I inositol polyphosphate 5-phosphatase 5 isoform X2 [Brachypodium distachyon]|nr:type I inositol polyphosphate 5-phosphatase 5 isoform X2 [Brachypodium distachyon]|eukprot:XP_024310664.1 type I inositol polyphosphate 5-phosphatase 5 isoform X2 [Brachypodium distachyon]
MDLNLNDLLPSDDQSDIYVLGFQEIVPLNAGNVLVNEDSVPAMRWLALIDHALNRPSSSSSPAMPTASHSFIQSTSSPRKLRRRRPPPSTSSSCLAISCGRRRRWRHHGETSSSSDEENDAVQPLPPPSSSSSLPPARKRTDGGGGYLMVASEQMVGLFATVWARRAVAPHMAHVRVSRVGLGLMGRRLGNKGSISISLALHQTLLCFVCSHLASGERPADELRRNADVLQILSHTRFRSLSGRRHRLPLPRRILDHQRVIWVGDMNYRIGMGYGEARALVDGGDWSALLEKDQLSAEINGGGVLSGWSEGEICFPPTYKYSSNSDCYAGDGEDGAAAAKKKKRRTPAWCDRILWHGEGIVQRGYGRGESRFSDHRPVCAAFLVDVTVRDDMLTKLVGATASMKVGAELLLLPDEP